MRHETRGCRGEGGRAANAARGNGGSGFAAGERRALEPQALAGLDFDGPFRPKNILLECDRALSIPAWGSRDNVAAYFADRGYELLDVFGRPLANEGPLPEENAWARDHT